MLGCRYPITCSVIKGSSRHLSIDRTISRHIDPKNTAMKTENTDTPSVPEFLDVLELEQVTKVEGKRGLYPYKVIMTAAGNLK